MPGFEQDLSFLVLRAFYDLRGLLDRLLVAEGLANDVQSGMGPLLYGLYDEDGCTLKELGERVQLAPSTLTNTIKRMEAKGLVRTKRDPADRRAVRVKLTAKARRLEPRMNGLRERVREVLYADLSEAEVARTRSVLARMSAAMEMHEWESNRPKSKEKSS